MKKEKEIFFISDPHFSHKNIIKYCNRSYDNVHEMNKDMTLKWNSVVSEDDDIYMLGDFYSNHPEKFIERLNGNMIWIRGNHDKNKQINIAKRMGIPVHQRLDFEYGGYKFLLNHKPVLFNTNEKSDYHVKSLEGYDYVICGHVHEKWITNQKCINVSVDAWNFTPVNIKEIIKLIEIKYEKKLV